MPAASWFCTGPNKRGQHNSWETVETAGLVVLRVSLPMDTVKFGHKFRIHYHTVLYHSSSHKVFKGHALTDTQSCQMPHESSCVVSRAGQTVQHRRETLLDQRWGGRKDHLRTVSKCYEDREELAEGTSVSQHLPTHPLLTHSIKLQVDFWSETVSRRFWCVDCWPLGTGIGCSAVWLQQQNIETINRDQSPRCWEA